MARTFGATGLAPNKRLLRDKFAEIGFHFAPEFKKLYDESPADIKAKLLLGIAEYLHPKRRAEDEDGNPGVEGAAALIVSEELALKMLAAARGNK